MSEILLSIVVPTYNRLPELQQMLESLLPQVQGKPVEILIADDQSTDSTWDWLESRFAGAPEVRFFRMEVNGGPCPARNRCLAEANGRYFLPIDSDFILMDGAIDKVLEVIRGEYGYRLYLFSCIQYPEMRRLDKIGGRREIGYESFLVDDLGELIPLGSLDWMRSRGLRYPIWRGGGETVLWAEYLDAGPALFVDAPIVLYRTDVPQRICTLDYQMAHPEVMAETMDGMLPLFSRGGSRTLRSALVRKYLAAGTYHLLAGNMRKGRRRLLSAVSQGCWPALAALAASFAGKDAFRRLFAFYRTRVAKAYL